ncbi:hypothetical protein AAC387_Pa02g4393 [Persea americana]
MSKDCFSSNIPQHVQALLMADLLSLFSFMLAHPLYFVYLLLFFPYLVQFLSFLSPLLMSTSLLLLSLLTISPHLEKPTRYGFLINACQKIVYALQTRLDDNGELELFEPLASLVLELEACLSLSSKGVEETVAVESGRGESLRLHEIEEFVNHGSSISMMSRRPTSKVEKELIEVPQETEDLGAYKSSSVVSQELTCNVDENCSGVSQRSDSVGVYEFQEYNSSLDSLWHECETESMGCKGLNSNAREDPVEVRRQIGELGAYEHNELKVSAGFQSLGHKPETRSLGSNEMTYNVGEKAIKIPQQNDELRAYEHQELKTSHLGCETRSIASQGLSCRVGENLLQVIDRDSKENSDVMGLNHGGFGSMRKEKEWKRTLACKLYEERQSVDGTEGMDLLWEVYEVDSGKAKGKNKKEKKVKKEDIDDDEEEEEEGLDSQLCCLQALRFSTGKMNLGMRRLNSMRISKAFKGIGLFVRRERKIF